MKDDKIVNCKKLWDFIKEKIFIMKDGKIVNWNKLLDLIKEKIFRMDISKSSNIDAPTSYFPDTLDDFYFPILKDDNFVSDLGLKRCTSFKPYIPWEKKIVDLTDNIVKFEGDVKSVDRIVYEWEWFVVSRALDNLKENSDMEDRMLKAWKSILTGVENE